VASVILILFLLRVRDCMLCRVVLRAVNRLFGRLCGRRHSIPLGAAVVSVVRVASRAQVQVRWVVLGGGVAWPGRLVFGD
jgi:hypothetical protein